MRKNAKRKALNINNYVNVEDEESEDIEIGFENEFHQDDHDFESYLKSVENSRGVSS